VEVGVDVIFPLAFLALLVPLLRTRIELLIAVLSGGLAWAISQVETGGLVILITGVAGSLLGAALTAGRRPDGTVDLDDARREVA
jgi:predicted branched-subunit amino acid permease